MYNIIFIIYIIINNIICNVIYNIIYNINMLHNCICIKYVLLGDVIVIPVEIYACDVSIDGVGQVIKCACVTSA